MDLGLEGTVAFVTGASKGIGKATARLLAQEGCRVVITARGDELLQRTAAELASETGGEVTPLQGDMSVVEDVERTVAETIGRFGRIDILVTCAGSSPGGLLENLTEDDWFGSLNLKFMGSSALAARSCPTCARRAGAASSWSSATTA